MNPSLKTALLVWVLVLLHLSVLLAPNQATEAQATLPQAEQTSVESVREIRIEIKSAKWVAPVIRSNGFPWGECTWFVSTKRFIPWFGNASSWYYQAGLYGFARGSQPRPGAIMVTRESYLGHVAFVERVNPDGSWVVSEYNYNWVKRLHYRTIYPGTVPLTGFIY